VKSLAHRPLILPAVLVALVITVTVCFPGWRWLLPGAALLLSLAACRSWRAACRPAAYSCRRTFSLIFLLLSLVLGAQVYWRVERCLARRAEHMHRSFPAGRRPLVFTAVVAGFPRGYPGYWQLQVRVAAPPAEFSAALPAGTAVHLRLPAAAYDDPRRIEAVVRRYRQPKNRFLAAGNFSRRLTGPWYFATLEDWRQVRIIVPRPAGGLFFIDRCRRWLYGRLALAVPDRELSGLLQALLLGTRDALSPAVKELFLDLGVFHLLAISGLHVGIVTGFVFILGTWLLNFLLPGLFPAGPRRAVALPAIAACWFYVLLTGMQLPALRAGIMATVFLVAIFLEIADDPPGALLLAVLIILTLWPGSLFQLSFQLSVAAVAAILLVMGAHRRLLSWLSGCWSACFSGDAAPAIPLGRWWHAGLKNLLTLLLVGTAAWLATFPLLLARIHFFSPFGLLGNLLLVPVFSLLLIPAGFLALLLLPLPVLGGWLMAGYARLLQLVLAACQWVQALRPQWRWSAAAMTPVEILLYYLFLLLLLALLLRPRRLLPLLGLAAVLAAAVFDWAWWYDQRHHPGRCQVTCFVGGPRPAMLLELPAGETILVNGGGYARSRFSLARQVIAPYCWARKIGRLDVLLLTAPQRGSVAGLDYLVRHFAVREIWYNGLWSGYPPFREFYALTRRFGIRWRKLSDLARTRYYPGGARVEFLAPPANLSRPLPPWRQLLDVLAPGFRLVCGRGVLVYLGGGREDSSLAGEDKATVGGPVDVLVWGRRPPPPAGLVARWRPRLLVVDRLPPGNGLNPGPRRRVWQLRQDGFLELRLPTAGPLGGDS